MKDSLANKYSVLYENSVEDMRRITDEEFFRHVRKAVREERGMSWDMDRAEFDDWVEEGAWDRIWAAYEHACQERDDAKARTHQKQIYDFEKAIGIPLPEGDSPRLDGLNFNLLRSLVAEEAREFNDAMVLLEFAVNTNCGIDPTPYWAEVIDAICDIDVVIHNTSNAMAIDTEPFFQEVMRTNMAKVGGPVREDGKRLKPEGWEPPRIKEMLEELLKDANAKAAKGE